MSNEGSETENKGQPTEGKSGSLTGTVPLIKRWKKNSGGQVKNTAENHRKSLEISSFVEAENRGKTGK